MDAGRHGPFDAIGRDPIRAAPSPLSPPTWPPRGAHVAPTLRPRGARLASGGGWRTSFPTPAWRREVAKRGRRAPLRRQPGRFSVRRRNSQSIAGRRRRSLILPAWPESVSLIVPKIRPRRLPLSFAFGPAKLWRQGGNAATTFLVLAPPCSTTCSRSCAEDCAHKEQPFQGATRKLGAWGDSRAFRPRRHRHVAHKAIRLSGHAICNS